MKQLDGQYRCRGCDPDKGAHAHNRLFKEHTVVAAVEEHFPDLNFQTTATLTWKGEDRMHTIKPDLYIRVSDQFALVIEVDENQHNSPGYVPCSERARSLWIQQALKVESIVMIRYNPDSFTDVHGVKWAGSFSYDSGGKLRLTEKHKPAWESRMMTLFRTIEHFLEFGTDKTCDVVCLCYDEFNPLEY